MSIMDNDYGWITQRRRGDSTDPFVSITEQITVINGKAVLREIPDEYSSMSITYGAKSFFIKNIKKSPIPDANNVVVDFNSNWAYFDAQYNNKQCTATYKGTGKVFIHEKMIATTIDENGNVIETLDQVVSSTTSKVDAKLAVADTKITAMNTATTAATNATTAANTATTNANNAATAANTAKTNADTAAASVNSAKDGAVAATTAANNAASAANTAKANADAATAAANTATTLANTAKTNADTATAAANTAKTNADTAATNANTKATYAQTQGDYAKASGEALVHKGTFSPTVAYIPKNIVYYSGATFMCIANTTGNIPTNTSYWQKVTNMLWKGVYSSTITYNFGDVVSDDINQNVYTCVLDGTLNKALTTTANWTLLMSVTSAITSANTATNAANNAAITANTAATNADNKTALAITATTNANTATTAANTAKSNADTATAAANTSKANADAATANANTARDAANMATIAANTAKANADSATSVANTAASNADAKAALAVTATTNANNATTAANTAKANAETATTAATTATTAATSAATAANTAKTNADTATSAANKAKTDAETATTAANTATTAANIAATNANTAKDSANAAATVANSAKTDAITATTNANNATLAANTAKTNADTATTNANNATTAANTARDGANTAATSAVNATTAANTARDAANTAASNANTVATATGHKGSYNASTAYIPNNIVDYNGSSYMNILVSTGVIPTDTTKWKPVAFKGDQGIQGIQGVKGDSVVWKGVYSASTAYVARDVVHYNGTAYINKLASTGNLPTNTGYWDIFASKGVDGEGSVIGVTSLNNDLVVAGTIQNPDLTISTSLKSSWNDKYTKTEVDSKISQATANIQWKPSVASYANIATAYPSPQDGWTVNVNDTDYTYRYTGSQWIAISANSIPNASASADGKMSIADYNKLQGITTQATKVVNSATNGNVTINGTETVVYTHPTGAGNNHVPTGGAAGNYLKYGASGTATWATPDLAGLSDSTITSPTSGQYLTHNGTKWVNSAIPVATTSTNGLMVSTDKTKLDSITSGANNYSHPTGDGNLHVPANGTTSNGKFLEATATAGTYQWANITASDVTQDASNRFVTDTEKTTWNAKAPLASPLLTGIPTAPTAAAGTNTDQLATTKFVETVRGGLANSIANYIPASEKNYPGGVATLDLNSNVVALGEKMGTAYTKRSFTLNFTGVANQKIDLFWTTAIHGAIRITIGGVYSGIDSSGMLVKEHAIVSSPPSTINSAPSYYSLVTGLIQNHLSIGELSFDSTNSRFRIPIEARSAYINPYAITVEAWTSVRDINFNISSVYTGAATTLPVAVQAIPDNTVTKSGYEIQKHSLTGNTGLGKGGVITVNANTLTETGYYSLAPASTNIPLAVGTTALNVQKFDASYISQEANVYATVNGSTTIRKFLRESRNAGSTWSVWIETSMKAISLANNVDLNTIPEGEYFAVSNASAATHTNMPPAVAGLAYYLKVARNVGDGVTQTLSIYVAGTPRIFVRNIYNSVFGPWYEIETTRTKDVALGYAGLDVNGDVLLSVIPDAVQKYSLTKDDGKALSITAGTDLNTVLTTGFYTGNALLNAPAGSSGWFHILVQTHSGTSDGTNYVVQRAISLNDTGTPVEWIRRRVNSTWQGTWVSIPNSSLYNVAGGLPQLDSGASVLPDNLPFGSVTNLLSDSGRFVGPENDPRDIACSETFANNRFFSLWNGTTVTSGGKFYHDNSTNGGAAGAINSDVVSLLAGISAATGAANGRYGTEFHIASYTMGSGTGNQNTTVPTTYLMTVNSSFPAAGVNKSYTVSFWIRVKSGTRAVINKSGRFKKNGVIQTTHIQLTPADGWVHIEAVHAASNGYSNAAPGIHATPGDIVQIAMPVVTAGDIGVGVHNNPVLGAIVGYTVNTAATPSTAVLRDNSGNINVNTKIGFSNDDGIEFDDTANVFSARMDGALYPIYTSANHNSTGDPHTQYALKASPALTGIPTAPTAAVGTASNQLATTAFVVANAPSMVQVGGVLPATVGWYRIATSSVSYGRLAARFEIDWTLAGYHGQVTINAGIMYGIDPTLNQVMYTNFGGNSGTGLTAARIVYHTTYTGNYAYLEVYNASAAALNVNTQLMSSMGWQLITPVAGSIPSGYVTSELKFVDGIATDGIIASPTVVNGDTHFSKNLGQVVFAATTANQKADVYFTGAFQGYLDVLVTGSWFGAPHSGLLRKRIEFHATGTGTINRQGSRFDEVFGAVGNTLFISDVSWDATNNRYRIQLCFLAPTAYTETFVVQVEGMNVASAAVVTQSMGIGAPYSTDSAVYQAPTISFPGVVNVPTQTSGDNSTKIANTAFVQANAPSMSSISATLPATTGWYRIAASAVEITRNAAAFAIDWSITGNHGYVNFEAATMFGVTTG